jgi:DNA-binding MarR family transcriptional regulator
MSPHLEILKQILPHLDAYVKTAEAASLDGFTQFLAKVKTEERNKSINETAISMMEEHAEVDASISFHLSRLGKYAKYYVKEAFKDIELIGGDDFGFLATVMQLGPIKKTELIRYNVHEVPGGMEIIKRLTKNGMFIEKVDLNDRRTKVVSMSEKGRKVFLNATMALPPVGSLVVAKLSHQDKNHLLVILKSLDHFHEIIYKNEKSYDLKLIQEKYLSSKSSL